MKKRQQPNRKMGQGQAQASHRKRKWLINTWEKKLNLTSNLRNAK